MKRFIGLERNVDSKGSNIISGAKNEVSFEQQCVRFIIQDG